MAHRGQGGGMFGQDDNQQANAWQDPAAPQQPVDTPMQDTATDGGAYVQPPADPVGAPATPTDWRQPAPVADAWGSQPTNEEPTPADAPTALVADAPSANNDLQGIKQKALTELSPLVGHLDQSPEEKFKTTTMLIQASDDQSLIPQAYESAQAITDEKVKAQALLDIVNEINYFSQGQN